MTKENILGKILRQLELAIEAGILPLDAVQTGKNLVNRLGSPVRVVILGLENSGKSQVLNLLAGQEIVPPGDNWPDLELCWGEHTSTQISRSDGTVDAHDGIATTKLTRDTADSVRIQAPIDILKSISLFEFNQNGGEDGYFSTVSGAVRHADMVLWCSQQFSEHEQSLWKIAPEELKDHSFFVLTKADELSASGELSVRIETIQDSVADEFHSLIPLATRQALSAIAAADEIDNGALKASGGQAILATVLQQVEMGRQADQDRAQMFLKRYGVDKVFANPPVVAAAAAAAEIVPRESRVIQIADLSRSALVILGEKAREFGNIETLDAAENVTGVLDICTETANQLADLFIEEISTQDDILAMQGELMETSDVILLLQMEDDPGSAADAVTLLLQIRRELETAQAA